MAVGSDGELGIAHVLTRKVAGDADGQGLDVGRCRDE
jgi:hypothetical protein